jgi:hypothetical protein
MERRTQVPTLTPSAFAASLDRLAGLAVDTADHPSFIIGYARPFRIVES